MTAAGRRIAIVEDEETIREAVSVAVAREGHHPVAFGDGLDAWTAFSASLPDLLVLDIGLPRLDGLEICRRVRALSETLPIIFVTSREDEFDRVLGLEIGADDYLCKPFSMRELIARVRVLLRRASLMREPVRDDDPVIRVGGLVLDPQRLSATWRSGRLPLTVTEFLLLQSLCSRPGVVKSRAQLMDDAYPDRVTVSDRTIDSHVKRIRRKIQELDPAFDAIEAVYGAGYRYNS